jgi:hypothetical protein
MALRLVSLLVSLVLLGFLATTMRDRLSPDKESPASPQTLLRTAGLALDRSHQITGTYAGAVMDGSSALRVVSADASGYCLQLEWVDRSVYHLRGPGGQPEPGVC